MGVLLTRPLKELLDPAAVGRALDGLRDSQAVRASLIPLVDAAHGRVAAAMRRREEPLGSFLGDEGKKELDALLGEPGLLDPDIVRALAEDPAVEGVLRDVLYDALKQFSDNVNPFFAEWGLPGLIDKLFPFGKGAVAKGLAGVRQDFERRLEPEIRKFIGSFARRALRKLADGSAEHGDAPEHVALRRRLAAVVLARPLRDLVWAPDDPKAQRLGAVVRATMATTAEAAALREELVSELDALVGEHGAASVGELCARLGMAPFDPTPIADAAWPAVRALLGSEVVRAEVEGALRAALAEAFALDAG